MAAKNYKAPVGGALIAIIADEVCVFLYFCRLPQKYLPAIRHEF